jgi:hypothetical protein
MLQSVSRGRILKRRLPKEFGSVPLFVTPESALSFWRRDIGKVDPFLLSMARELVRPNMIVWDIGANVGLFSFAAAALGAKIVAVEPDAWLASLIHRSTLTVCPSRFSPRPSPIDKGSAISACPMPGDPQIHLILMALDKVWSR